MDRAKPYLEKEQRADEARQVSSLESHSNVWSREMTISTDEVEQNSAYSNREDNKTLHRSGAEFYFKLLLPLARGSLKGCWFTSLPSQGRVRPASPAGMEGSGCPFVTVGQQPITRALEL